jgi:hypothetical protein
MKRLLILLVITALAAFAGDVAGIWKATAEGPNGTMERTFIFQVDGEKLTGETTSSFLGKSTIADGKVDGDNITFTITVKLQDNDTKVTYKGKVSGKQIKLTSEFGGDNARTIEWTGKRVD